MLGRKQKKIQWRANLPIIITVGCVLGIVYGAVSLIISQIKPEAEPISTITITRNTPSASELNLSAPLVDYNPNKDECQEERLGNETDEEREKRLAECKERKEKEEEEKKKGAEIAEGDTTEVLGEQESKPAFTEVMARIIGASAAKSNSIKNNSTSNKESKSKEEDILERGGSSADGVEDKSNDSVGEDADN